MRSKPSRSYPTPDNFAVVESLSVEIVAQFRGDRITGFPVENSELLNLINNAEVSGDIYSSIVRSSPCIAVNPTGELLQMHAENSKTE